MSKLYLAIPHYNSQKQLHNLLSQVESDSLDGIYVLDDASANRQLTEAVAAKHPTVKFIYGETNLGAGGNRNRILEKNLRGHVWFLDCDMSIRSKTAADNWRQCIARFPDDLLGGSIENNNRHIMGWSYGRFINPLADGLFFLLTTIRVGVTKKWLQDLSWDYPWLYNRAPKTPIKVDWVAEGSFVIPALAFKQVAGYDQDFRYHEGQDLAWRLMESGVASYATNCVSTIHVGSNVRQTPKIIEKSINAVRFYFTHRGRP